MHVTRLLSVLRYPIMRNDRSKTRFRSIFIVSDIEGNEDRVRGKKRKRNESETSVISIEYLALDKDISLDKYRVAKYRSKH